MLVNFLDRFYRTSSTLDRIFAFPPEGSAKIVLHSRHLTCVDAFPNIVCFALHFEHWTLMNFPFLSIKIGEDFGF